MLATKQTKKEIVKNQRNVQKSYKESIPLQQRHKKLFLTKDKKNNKNTIVTI